jgi:hypothetical protein
MPIRYSWEDSNGTPFGLTFDNIGSAIAFAVGQLGPNATEEDVISHFTDSETGENLAEKVSSSDLQSVASSVGYAPLVAGGSSGSPVTDADTTTASPDAPTPVAGPTTPTGQPGDPSPTPQVDAGTGASPTPPAADVGTQVAGTSSGIGNETPDGSPLAVPTTTNPDVQPVEPDTVSQPEGTAYSADDNGQVTDANPFAESSPTDQSADAGDPTPADTPTASATDGGTDTTPADTPVGASTDNYDSEDSFVGVRWRTDADDL